MNLLFFSILGMGLRYPHSQVFLAKGSGCPPRAVSLQSKCFLVFKINTSRGNGRVV